MPKHIGAVWHNAGLRAPALLLLLALCCPGDEGQATEQQRLEELCAELTGRIEEWMGVGFGRGIPVRVVGRDWLTGLVGETERRLTPARTLAMMQVLAERLHLVPKGYDILERQLDLFRRMVAGLYDCEEDRFFVVEGMAEGDLREFAITAAHELVHAHRDGHTDFWARILRLAPTNADAALALRCLVEGDATLLGNAFGVAHLSSSATPQVLELVARNAERNAREFRESMNGPGLREFPAALREMLIAPYTDGEVFAAALYRAGGAAALRRAFDDPPRSTEQVLHPEKYLAARPDEPVAFGGGDPSAALGGGWTAGYSDTVGELELRVHLTPLLGRERAVRAAAGWDGARYHLCLRDGAAPFFGLVSAWDSEQDAWEFAGAWAEWAARRDGAKAPRRMAPGGWAVATAEGEVRVEVRGTLVLVADGVPEGREAEVLAALASAER